MAVEPVSPLDRAVLLEATLQVLHLAAGVTLSLGHAGGGTREVSAAKPRSEGGLLT